MPVYYQWVSIQFRNISNEVVVETEEKMKQKHWIARKRMTKLHFEWRKKRWIEEKKIEKNELKKNELKILN